MASEVYCGDYRTVSMEDDRACVIVDISNPHTSLRQLIKVQNIGDSMMQIDNCAAMLAMCLNAGMDVLSLHEALIQHRAGPVAGGLQDATASSL